MHYLDDISFQMFEQGLQENRGVFTVGTFEAIVGGAHTIQAQTDAREEAERRRAELEQRRLERARAAARERDGESGEGAMRVKSHGADWIIPPSCHWVISAGVNTPACSTPVR